MLDGRVVCYQPATGYRSAIDPILLQSAVPAKAGDTVLDLGCGIGAASLALAARVEGLHVSGLDFQGLLVHWASKGSTANGMADHVRFYEGNVLDPQPPIKGIRFDHVMANPPYAKAGTSRPSPDPVKAAATVEGKAKLADWVVAAAGLAGPGGSVTFIHRGDRAAELVDLMKVHFGELAILSFFARTEDADPSRIIVQGRAGGMPSCSRLAPIILHKTGGAYTSQADLLLRGQAALDLSNENSDP